MKNKEKIIGTVCILLIAIVFTIGGYLINRDQKSFKSEDDIFVETKEIKEENIFNDVEEKDKSDNNLKNEGNIDNSKTDENIVVDIKGAVKNPKEYKLNKGSRIRDLIDKAGGLTEDANKDMIHFSKILADEDCIIIPKLGEENTETVINQSGELPNNLQNNNKSLNNSSSSGKININKASIEELQSLPGIGETRAKAIVDYRDLNGGFKSVEELSNIDGIGSKTMDKLVDKVDIR